MQCPLVSPVCCLISLLLIHLTLSLSSTPSCVSLSIHFSFPLGFSKRLRLEFWYHGSFAICHFPTSPVHSVLISLFSFTLRILFWNKPIFSNPDSVPPGNFAVFATLLSSNVLRFTYCATQERPVLIFHNKHCWRAKYLKRFSRDPEEFLEKFRSSVRLRVLKIG